MGQMGQRIWVGHFTLNPF